MEDIKTISNESLNNKGTINKNNIIFAITLLILVAFTRLFIIEPYLVPSASMETTIETGENVLANKLATLIEEPKYKDIVTFNSPAENKILIKRVIATEGRTIDIKDGKVILDGKELDEPYTNGEPTDKLDSNIVYPYNVPEGFVWVMGDNRTNSIDSRMFGAIPIENIDAKAFAVYYPLTKIRLLN